MTASLNVAEANANVAPDLGVLFVHGIGHQVVGETIVKFGDPLLRWLNEWLLDGAAKRAGKKAEDLTLEEIAQLKLLDVTETQVKAEGGIPAHSHVEIGLTEDNNGQARRWILAESCWAEAFVPPTFKALAFWGLVVYPWTNATHYGSRIRRKWSRACNRKGALRRTIFITRALVAIAFLLIISVPLSIIVLVLLTLLLLLAIPPIPSLRAMLLRVQQGLADTLGDCFILVASPVQRAAIVSHVRRDLNWLISQDCKNIAIVAHSQGAAIAFEALSTGVLRTFCQLTPGESNSSALRKSLLITFGSGLAKLRELESALVTGKAKIGWMPIGGLALLALSLEFYKVINVIPFVGQSFYTGSWCAFFGLTFWIAGVRSGAEERLQPNNFEPRRKFKCDTKWRDYYASHDPVPNGSLFDADQPFLKCEEVHNFASLWRDHTTYWRNRDQFVPAIIRDLAELSQLPLFDLLPGDEKKVQIAADRRVARVQWLVYARSVIWMCAALVIITRWSDLPRVGGIVLSQLPLLEKAFRWFGLKEISNAEFTTSFLAQDLAGIAAVLFCAIVAYEVVRLVWQIWTWSDTRALLQRESHGPDEPRWLFFVVALTLVNIGILVSMGLPRTIVASSPPNSGSGFIAYVFAPGFLAGGIVYLWRRIRGRENLLATVWAATVAALLVAPVMALSLTIGMDDWYRLGILAELAVLGCLLIHYFGVRIEAEHRANV